MIREDLRRRRACEIVAFRVASLSRGPRVWIPGPTSLPSTTYIHDLYMTWLPRGTDRLDLEGARRMRAKISSIEKYEEYCTKSSLKSHYLCDASTSSTSARCPKLWHNRNFRVRRTDAMRITMIVIPFRTFMGRKRTHERHAA